MSSSTSSSSHSRRTPLHERSNSEKNIQQIRLVPYTPPKIDADEAESHAPAPETPTRDATFHPAKGRTGSTSTIFGQEKFIGSAVSLPSSSSSPATSSTWVKGKGVSESRRVSDLSGTEHPAPPARPVPRTSHGSSIRHVNAPIQQSHGQHDNASASPPTYTKPVSRRGRAISINSDGTFIVVKSPNIKVSTGSESTAKSYSHSNTSAFSSHGETSFDAHTDDLPSTFSSLAERSVSPSSPGTSAAPTQLQDDHIAASSPWNYRMLGGLRKVQKTPDSKAKGKGKEIWADRLPILPERTGTARVSESSSPLTLKPSFVTESSESASDDTANYKVIGRSSPPLPESDSADVSPSSSSSNYQLFGQSSGHQSFASSPARGQGVLDTPGSRNFIVHGTPYAASEQAALETPGSRNFIVHSNVTPSPSVYHLPRVPRSEASSDSFGQESGGKYSQESLVIPPLRPHKRSSSENLYLNRTPREAAHGRSNSYSSISSILTQDTGPNVVRLGHTPSASSSLRHALWAGRSTAPPKSRMDVHQWSSQLSPVMSEYEGSDRTSRMTSLGSHGERGSRNMQSISSSLFDNLEPTQAAPQTHSRSGSLEQPGAVFMRGARELPNRTVRDHDEHGDGLADLQQMHELQSKSSRSRLGFLSRNSSDRSSRSTSSSRAGNLASSSLPTWARVYYGSGERRWLASPIISEDDDSPPPSTWALGSSPPPEQFSQNIYNPRRRPREAQNIDTQMLSPEIPQPGIGDIRRGPKKKSSSIWSPHLRPDNRASGYSLWRPPSGTWSAENRILGPRNIQLVLFVVGFIFPFAWMIAAFLPLPPRPQFDMQEREKSSTPFRAREDSRAELLHERVAPIDDLRYQSARWWRNLNRYMSIIGLLILGAVAALIVVGIRQRWGK